MTEDNDALNDETSMAVPPNETDELLDEDFADEDEELDDDDADLEPDDEELDSLSDELSPYDIFGLDPLDVLTLDELADYLKVSPAAVRRAIKDQNLPGRNIGGEWRFLRDAVANWLRNQEAPAVQQQQARESFAQSKPKFTPTQEESEPQYSRPPRRPYKSDQQGGGGYRARQQYGEGRPAYGQRSRDQYSSEGEQFGEQSIEEGSFEGGYQSRPPRRPFRSYDNRGEGNFQGNAGYSGGYGAGGNRFGGGPKRKNKKHVFEKERGRRMDRRKDNDAAEGQG